jgi:hypothetical protein
VSRGLRWLVAVMVALAAFGACWLGLEASHVLDTATDVGISSVPLVVLLAVLGAWAERARKQESARPQASLEVRDSPLSQAVGRIEGGITIGPGASFPGAVFNLPSMQRDGKPSTDMSSAHGPLDSDPTAPIDQPTEYGQDVSSVPRSGEAALSRRDRVLADALDAARSISTEDEWQRVLAQTSIARVVTTFDPNRAVLLIADAEHMAESIPAEASKNLALVSVTEAMAIIDADRAEHIARSITDEDRKASALGWIVYVIAAADPGRAERIARSISYKEVEAPALALIAKVVSATDPARAARLIEEAERLARSISYDIGDAEFRDKEIGMILASIAIEVAAFDPDHAVRIARSITSEDESSQARTLVTVAEAMSAADPDRAARLIVEAERIAQSITSEFSKAYTLAGIADAVRAADPDRVARLIAEVEHIARSITSVDTKSSLLADIVKVVAAADPDRAERIAQSIVNEDSKAVALARIVGAIAAADPGRAEHIAESITSEYWKAVALTSILRAAATVVSVDGASSGSDNGQPTNVTT